MVTALDVILLSTLLPELRISGCFCYLFESGVKSRHALCNHCSHGILLSGQSLLGMYLTHATYCTRCRHDTLPVLQGKNGEVTYVFEPGCHLGAKLAGVHWWFKSRAHAAELTAGYYNTRERDGYAPLMEVLKKYHTHLSFTCVEMRDCEHPPEGRCSPQGPLFHFPCCHAVVMTTVSKAEAACIWAAHFPGVSHLDITSCLVTQHFYDEWACYKQLHHWHFVD